jgi:hypothetical protein
LSQHLLRTTPGRWLPTAVACLLAAYTSILLLASPFTQTVFGRGSGPLPLGDFGSFYASGQAAGQGLDPFDVYPLTMDANLGRGQGAAVNLNAPFSVVLFQLMAIFDPQSARLGWFVATLAACAVMVVVLLRTNPITRRPLQFIWPFAMAGFWETINLGQIYGLLALLTTGAWLLLERRPLMAGVLLGAVIAVKPNFAVWPLLLALVVWRRAALAALLSAAVFGCIPMVMYGPGVYGQWLSALRLEGPNSQVSNAALSGLMTRFGAPQLALPIAALGLAALGWWVWTRRPNATDTNAIAVLGLLLCSPLAWVGYTMFLLPVFLGRRWSPSLALAAALLWLPRLPLQQLVDATPVLESTVGSVYSVAWILALWSVVAGIRRENARAG